MTVRMNLTSCFLAPSHVSRSFFPFNVVYGPCQVDLLLLGKMDATYKLNEGAGARRRVAPPLPVANSAWLSAPGPCRIGRASSGKGCELHHLSSRWPP